MNDRVDSLASNRDECDNVENIDSNDFVSGQVDAAGGDSLGVGGLLTATKHLNQCKVAGNLFIQNSSENASTIVRARNF